MLECFLNFRGFVFASRAGQENWQRARSSRRKSWLQKSVFYGSAKNEKQEKSVTLVYLSLEAIKITWYWTGARRAQLPRRKELLSRLYQRVLVGDAWGNWRLTIGGSVADLVRCFDCPWIRRWFDEWSSDFDRFASLGLNSGSSCKELMMAPLRGDFDSLVECLRGGFMEIRDDGGVESNNEKRRNILRRFGCNLRLWV